MTKVLLIDDDPQIRRAFERELQTAGFDVIGVACDPVEARGFYDAAEVVVSDWQMPHGGGARVLAEAPVPVVVHSAIAGMVGAKFWINKPAQRDELREEIERALQPKGGES